MKEKPAPHLSRPDFFRRFPRLIYFCIFALFLILTLSILYIDRLPATSPSLIVITPQNFRQYTHPTGAGVANNAMNNSVSRTYQFTDYIYSVANHRFVSVETSYGGGSYTMLRARAFSPHAQETFNWYYNYRAGTWQIQSAANGLFVLAELGNTDGAYAMLRAHTPGEAVSSYEQFHLYYDISTRNNVIQSAANGLYVTAEFAYNGGNAAMLRAHISNTAIYVWEQFIV